jgi:hypothetical protein
VGFALKKGNGGPCHVILVRSQSNTNGRDAPAEWQNSSKVTDARQPIPTAFSRRRSGVTKSASGRESRKVGNRPTKRTLIVLSAPYPSYRTSSRTRPPRPQATRAVGRPPSSGRTRRRCSPRGLWSRCSLWNRQIRSKD